MKVKSRITRVIVLEPGQFVIRSARDMFTDSIVVNDGELAGSQFHLVSWKFDEDVPVVIAEETNRWGHVLRSFHQANNHTYESSGLAIVERS